MASLTVTSNEGTVQDLNIDTSDITASNNGAGISQPFVMAKTADADGESVRTSFVAYDSLGTPLTVDLTFVLQSAVQGVGTTWQFLAESADNDALDRVVGVGQVTFDDNGKLLLATSNAMSIRRANGAQDPLNVDLNLH
jgi:flagellar hook protein FlgE